MMQYPRPGFPLVPSLLRELFGRMEVPADYQKEKFKTFPDLDESAWEDLGEEAALELSKSVVTQMQSRLSTIPKVIRQRRLPKISKAIQGKELPFSNRTRLSLEREGLLDQLHLLSGHPIQVLLEFRAFGGKCLLDFLTVLEKTLRDQPGGMVEMDSEAILPLPEPPLPSPKSPKEKEVKLTRAQGSYPRKGDPLSPKLLLELFQNKPIPESLGLADTPFQTFADLDQRVWDQLPQETCEELAKLVAKRVQSRFSTLPKVIRSRRLPKIHQDIHLHDLPLSNRTFLSLERELPGNSLAPLSGKTINELLQFRAFGGKCLLDFLSLLQKTLETHPEGWQEAPELPASDSSALQNPDESNASPLSTEGGKREPNPGEESAMEMVFDPKRIRLSQELSTKFANPPLKVYPRVGFPLIPKILKDMFDRTKIPENLGVHEHGYKVLSDLDASIWDKLDPQTCEALGKLVVARVQSRLSTIPKSLRQRRLPIFPRTLKVKDLPLMNRTKLSLEREGHVNTFNKLSGKQLQSLLEFKAFGGKCLLDLLTLFDATLIPLDEAPQDLLVEERPSGTDELPGSGFKGDLGRKLEVQSSSKHLPKKRIPVTPLSSTDALRPEEGLLLRQCEHLGKRLLGKSIGLNMEEFMTKMAAKTPRGIRMDQLLRILPLIEDFVWLHPNKQWFTLKNRMNKYNPVVHRIQTLVAEGKTKADQIYEELGKEPGLRGRLVPKSLFPKFLSLLPGIQKVARKTQGREDKLAFLRRALEAVEN